MNILPEINTIVDHPRDENNLPKVSVVMPAYNVEKYIGEAIESLIAQTFHEWELVVVSDRSTDATVEIASRYAASDSRIRVFELEKGSGSAYTPRRIAIEFAGAPVVAPLDADDWVSDNYLEKLMECRCRTKAEVVYPTLKKTDGRTTIGGKLPDDERLYNSVMPGREAVKLTLDGWRINCNGGAIDKKLYMALFAEYGDSLAYSCGDEFLGRALLYSAEKVSFSDAEYFYRMNDASITHNKSLKLFDWMKNNIGLIEFADERFGKDSEEYIRAQRQNVRGIYDAMELRDNLGFDPQEKRYIDNRIQEARNAVNWKCVRRNVTAPYYFPLKISAGTARLAIRVIRRLQRYLHMT